MSKTFTSVSVDHDRGEAVAVSYNQDGYIQAIHRVDIPEEAGEPRDEPLEGLAMYDG